MFRQLATRLPVDQLFDLHPVQLAQLLERIWGKQRRTGVLGSPDNRSNINKLPPWLPNVDPDPLPRGSGGGDDDGDVLPMRWDHLIYAYMVENTRIYEIFRRVVFEYLHGEKLGTPDPQAQRWLRTTEELFYKPGSPFLITSVISDLRADGGAITRNAYKRMFDMELNHGGADGRPYAYVKPEAVNSEFVATFEEFLREVWVGMIYVNANATSNPTDPAKIAVLASKLHDMLRSRQQNGNLQRETFAAVTRMSWFHLTIESDTPIVRSLRADTTGTEQRLFKVAERVGMPAHGLSKHFFSISDHLSRILTQIEMGDYNKADAVPALYTPVQAVDTPEAAMRQIITDWTAITGRDVKARKVAAS